MFYLWLHAANLSAVISGWHPMQMPPCQSSKFHCLGHHCHLEETLDETVLVEECDAGAIAFFVPLLLPVF
jgi:hypothetical protein